MIHIANNKTLFRCLDRDYAFYVTYVRPCKLNTYCMRFMATTARAVEQRQRV